MYFSCSNIGSSQKRTTIIMHYERHKSNSLLTWCWNWFLWHCHQSFAKWYICIISIYNLPRLCTKNVNKSNTRKWFHAKKSKKQTTSCRNYHGCRLFRWSSISHKYTLSQIPATWPGAGSKRHWSIWTQIRVHVL